MSLGIVNSYGILKNFKEGYIVNPSNVGKKIKEIHYVDTGGVYKKIWPTSLLGLDETTYYPFNGDVKDYSGNNNPINYVLSSVEPQIYTQGFDARKSMVLNPISGHIVTGNDVTSNLSWYFSICFKPIVAGSAIGIDILSSKRNAFLLAIYNKTSLLVRLLNGNAGIIADFNFPTKDLLINKWNNLIVGCYARQYRVILNGNIISSTQDQITLTPNTLLIGGTLFTGELQDYIFSKELDINFTQVKTVMKKYLGNMVGNVSMESLNKAFFICDGTGTTPSNIVIKLPLTYYTKGDPIYLNRSVSQDAWYSNDPEYGFWIRKYDSNNVFISETNTISATECLTNGNGTYLKIDDSELIDLPIGGKLTVKDQTGYETQFLLVKDMN